MNTEIFTESFDQFSSKLSPTDIALYAGAGIVLWIMFKDKLSPVQTFISDIYGKILSKTNNSDAGSKNITNLVFTKTDDNTFFDLISSWKKTRDLAVKIGCDQAVSVADEMFPFLSPNACNKKNENKSEKVQP